MSCILARELASYASARRHSPLTQTQFWPFQHKSWSWAEPHGRAVPVHLLKGSSRGALAAHSANTTGTTQCKQRAGPATRLTPILVWSCHRKYRCHTFHSHSHIYVYLHQNNGKKSSVLFGSHLSTPPIQLLGAILHCWIDLNFHFCFAFYH